MTQTVAVVAGAIVATLLGVIVGFILTGYQQQRENARQDRIRYERAIAELLAASLDLLTGARVLRLAHGRNTRWRFNLRLAGDILVALPEVTSTEVLKDYETMRSLMGCVMNQWRDQIADQRMVALDTSTVLVPRVIRFFQAVALVTLGDDEVIADAVRAVTPKVYALLGSLAAHKKQFGDVSSDMEKALEAFRSTVDERLAAKH